MQHIICNWLVQAMRDGRRYGGQRRSEKEAASEGDLSSEAGRRLHLAGEFVVADRPRLPDRGREVFPKRLFEGPQQRFLQRVVVGELDAVPDMTDGEITDRRQNLTRLDANCRRPWRAWSSA